MVTVNAFEKLPQLFLCLLNECPEFSTGLLARCIPDQGSDAYQSTVCAHLHRYPQLSKRPEVGNPHSLGLQQD